MRNISHHLLETMRDISWNCTPIFVKLDTHFNEIVSTFYRILTLFSSNFNPNFDRIFDRFFDSIFVKFWRILTPNPFSTRFDPKTVENPLTSKSRTSKIDPIYSAFSAGFCPKTSKTWYLHVFFVSETPKHEYWVLRPDFIEISLFSTPFSRFLTPKPSKFDPKTMPNLTSNFVKFWHFFRQILHFFRQI